MRFYIMTIHLTPIGLNAKKTKDLGLKQLQSFLFKKLHVFFQDGDKHLRKPSLCRTSTVSVSSLRAWLIY